MGPSNIVLDSARVKNVENHCFKANGQIEINLYFVLIHKPKKSNYKQLDMNQAMFYVGCCIYIHLYSNS